MLIRKLKIEKILSFKDTTVELRQLNVLIGANAVGKSNLIEAISLLRAAPSSLAGEIHRGGGVRQWIWLGDPIPSPIAKLSCDLVLTRGRQNGPLTYQLEFSEDAKGFVILSERLDGDSDNSYLERSLNKATVQRSPSAAVSETDSVLSRFKSPIDPTPITEVGNHFEQIRIFREFRTGPSSQARWGISAASGPELLSDGGDNLALALNELDFQGVHDRIRHYLGRFCERFEDVKVKLGSGLAQTYLREAGIAEMLSAVRMSDGTLKFLCLLAALFHPKPPPLMCIEEPELGIHPEALQLVAEALIEASESMQIIVTTHSNALIDWLSDRPETVLVCERDFENSTQFTRLSKENLHEWLQHYSLGDLWRKGEIGGGRW